MNAWPMLVHIVHGADRITSYQGVMPNRLVLPDRWTLAAIGHGTASICEMQGKCLNV